MPLFTKPQFNSVWASTGAKLTPDVAKISQGWVVEIPPHEFDNWMQNRQDALLAHLNQLGIPQWDSTVEYQAGKSYVQGTTTGVVYKALTTHFNVNPEIDIQNNWVVAFESSGSALLKVNNLSDVPDKAQARINLGIPDTTFYDTRYLVKVQNFADVPNKSSARNNLDVFSKTEVSDLINLFCPAGEVAPFAMSNAPEGWLVCNGTAVNRVTYARLFSAIGTRFGTGNGSTTFNLPDLRGEFIRGWDNGRGLDNSRAFGTPQAPTLVGGYDDNSAEVDVSYLANKAVVEYGADRVRPPLYLGAVGKYLVGQSNRSATIGDGFFGATRPTNVALLYCIRY